MKKLIFLAMFMVACDVGNQAKQPVGDDGALPSTTTDTHHIAKQNIEAEVVIPVSSDPIVYLDYRDDCWHLGQLKIDTELTTITHPSITCFESYHEDDLSPNGEVSLLHTLERGELDDGNEITSIEKYACYFIDIRSGNLSEAHSDSMCSGEWSAESSWVVDEDERYTIAELF